MQELRDKAHSDSNREVEPALDGKEEDAWDDEEEEDEECAWAPGSPTGRQGSDLMARKAAQQAQQALPPSPLGGHNGRARIGEDKAVYSGMEANTEAQEDKAKHQSEEWYLPGRRWSVWKAEQSASPERSKSPAPRSKSPAPRSKSPASRSKSPGQRSPEGSPCKHVVFGKLYSPPRTPNHPTPSCSTPKPKTKPKLASPKGWDDLFAEHATLVPSCGVDVPLMDLEHFSACAIALQLVPEAISFEEMEGCFHELAHVCAADGLQRLMLRPAEFEACLRACLRAVSQRHRGHFTLSAELSRVQELCAAPYAASLSRVPFTSKLSGSDGSFPTPPRPRTLPPSPATIVE